jgi:hypothetical protein
MMPVTLFSSVIGTEDRRRETETPNYQLCANYTLASSAYCLLPTAKVVDNQNKIRNDASNLIFFAYWGRRPLPEMQAGKTGDRNSQLSIMRQLYSCLFCLLAK